MNERDQRRSIAPVVFSIVLTIAFLAFIGYAASRRRSAEQAVPPQLNVLAPVTGDVVDSAITIRFTSSRPLTAGPGGWGDGPFHVHAWIDNTEYMPAASDIRSMGDSTYEWLLVPRVRGQARLQLSWADRQHRRIGADSPPAIILQIR